MILDLIEHLFEIYGSVKNTIVYYLELRPKGKENFEVDATGLEKWEVLLAIFEDSLCVRYYNQVMAERQLAKFDFIDRIYRCDVYVDFRNFPKLNARQFDSRHYRGALDCIIYLALERKQRVTRQARLYSGVRRAGTAHPPFAKATAWQA